MRHFTGATPLAQLRLWAGAAPGRRLNIGHGPSTVHIEAHEPEWCDATRRYVHLVHHGNGRTTDLAADQCLAHIRAHRQENP